MIEMLFQIFIATFLLEGSVTFIRMYWGSVTHKRLRNADVEKEITSFKK